MSKLTMLSLLCSPGAVHAARNSDSELMLALEWDWGKERMRMSEFDQLGGEAYAKLRESEAAAEATTAPEIVADAQASETSNATYSNKVSGRICHFGWQENKTIQVYTPDACKSRCDGDNECTAYSTLEGTGCEYKCLIFTRSCEEPLQEVACGGFVTTYIKDIKDIKDLPSTTIPADKFKNPYRVGQDLRVAVTREGSKEVHWHPGWVDNVHGDEVVAGFLKDGVGKAITVPWYSQYIKPLDDAPPGFVTPADKAKFAIGKEVFNRLDEDRDGLLTRSDLTKLASSRDVGKGDVESAVEDMCVCLAECEGRPSCDSDGPIVELDQFLCLIGCNAASSEACIRVKQACSQDSLQRVLFFRVGDRVMYGDERGQKRYGKVAKVNDVGTIFVQPEAPNTKSFVMNKIQQWLNGVQSAPVDSPVATSTVKFKPGDSVWYLSPTGWTEAKIRREDPHGNIHLTNPKLRAVDKTNKAAQLKPRQPARRYGKARLEWSRHALKRNKTNTAAQSRIQELDAKQHNVDDSTDKAPDRPRGSDRPGTDDGPTGVSKAAGGGVEGSRGRPLDKAPGVSIALGTDDDSTSAAAAAL